MAGLARISRMAGCTQTAALLFWQQQQQQQQDGRLHSIEQL
jgi:hypothetical protein